MKWLKNYIQKSRKREITAFVFAAHVALILALFAKHFLFYPKQKRQEKILVQHIAIKPPPRPKRATLAKKPAPPKKPAPQKKQPLTKKPENKQLQNIARSLEKMDPAAAAPSKKSPFQLEIPEKLSTPAPKKSVSPPISYESHIVQLLHTSLDLPEFGAVKLKISIDSLGRVQAIEILEKKSEKNARYLKEAILNMSFPRFEEFSLDQKQMEFTISFKNLELQS